MTRAPIAHAADGMPLHASPLRGPTDWLEVHQVWGDLVLDTRHFRPSEAVTAGAALCWRWHFLGVDVGEVSPSLAKVLPWLPPVWSEVRQVPRASLPAGEEELPGDTTHELFVQGSEGWQARVAPHWSVRAALDGEELSVEELLDRELAHRDGPWVVVPLSEGLFLEVVLGTRRFVSRAVARPPAMARAAWTASWPPTSRCWAAWPPCWGWWC